MKSNINHFIVIGAGSPVGQALVTKIAKDPTAHILMTTRQEYAFCETVKQSNPGRVTYQSNLDFSLRPNLKILKDMVSGFTAKQPYAVIVSTSYFPEHKPFIETSFDEAEEIRKANLDVPVGIIRTLIPHMLNNQGSHFIGFSCQSVHHNYPFMSDFTAAKAALPCYTKTWANEHGSHGLGFNNFALGSVKTSFTVNSKPNGDTENYITPKQTASLVIDFLKGKNRLLMNGQTFDAYKFSAVDHSQKGWATRIQTTFNKNFLASFLGWKPETGKDFPRMENFC